MRNVLIVGSGAREYALSLAVHQSHMEHRLHVIGSSKNPSIVKLADIYQVADLTDIEAVSQLAKSWQIDVVIIGPEAPLEAGLADALTCPVIGPTKGLARIETSKGYARELLDKFSPISRSALPKYQFFETFIPEAKAFLEALGEDYVIKADGLKGGKGVKVSGEHLHSLDEALAYCEESGQFVIEEKLYGPEFSLISFCDGENIQHAPIVQDHKRALQGDLGPNTGGMGSYSDTNHSLPFLNTIDVLEAQALNAATMQALNEDNGEPYIGFLYGGFMKTQNGVKLIEYNARFGDPEAINILALLESDFLSLVQAMITQNLDTFDLQFKPQATVVKYIVPEGYPEKSVKNQEINVSCVSDSDALYMAAIDEQDGKLVMTGSRAIAVLGVGDHIQDAEAAAEKTCQEIKGPVFYRPDIGTESLIQTRMQMLEEVPCE